MEMPKASRNKPDAIVCMVRLPNRGAKALNIICSSVRPITINNACIVLKRMNRLNDEFRTTPNSNPKKTSRLMAKFPSRMGNRGNKGLTSLAKNGNWMYRKLPKGKA